MNEFLLIRLGSRHQDIIHWLVWSGSQQEVIASGEMPLLERNYLEKHNALNRTAWALTEHGLSFVAAKNLHHQPEPELA